MEKGRFMKLHIACGERYYTGWVNIDIGQYKVDLHHDVTKPFPFEKDSVDVAYCEHFIEHLTVEECKNMLNNCYAVLKHGGVFRIATFDLDEVIQKYVTDWKDQCWIPSHAFIKNKAEMLNIAFTWWGHHWLYNEEELIRRINDSNFKSNIRKATLGMSENKDLCNVETRLNSTLIIEAIKN